MLIRLRQFIKETSAEFKKAGILSPNLDAEILVCHAIEKPKSWLYVNFDYKLSKRETKKINNLIQKRKKGVPVAYITGHKEFYKLDFFVNKNVLIPRPETEIIVEGVINQLQTTPPAGGLQTNIIDIGVGSGAIIISLAKNIKNKNINFFGTEISDKALYMARKNAKLHKVDKKIKFLKGDLLEPIIKNYKLQTTHYKLIITANLPYLTPKQVKEEKSIQSEPKLALIGGKDGLKYYRIFFKQLRKLSQITNLHLPALSTGQAGGKAEFPITTIIEFDPSQTNKLKKIIKNNLSSAKIQIKKDLCGRDRIMIVNT